MTTESNCDQSSIAIIAMDCRLPGAASIEELWTVLSDGTCTLSDLEDDDILRSGVAASRLRHPNYVKRAGVLPDIDRFDSQYFDMSAIEADVLDVQQRAMLESSVTLLNRGNIDPARFPGRIGVFAGSAFSSYLFGVLERSDVVDSLGEMMIRHGNDKDFLATRISYKLNLRGPSVNVQTACSTGLVAVHAACQSLMLGECDTAIAGSVNIKVPQHTGYLYQPDGVLSPDGNCRPLDAESNGTLFTNGLGLVLLKPLQQAILDGDDIYAVIKGAAISNDGASKVGFTAPSVNGQVQALAEAIELSGIDPQDIQYIEAHGTGTTLGDPIEVEAIKQAYGEAGLACGIGSLKGNFGHFNIAAGVIGLIKAALILKHKTIPATLFLATPNPLLELEDSRFYVTGQEQVLDPQRAQVVAVSAFGMGGTNCHMILEGYRQTVVDSQLVEPTDKPGIFTLSAKSRPAVERLVSDYQQYFDQTSTPLLDTMHTAYHGRPILPCRVALVAQSNRQAKSLLAAGNFHQFISGDSSLSAFVFSGQGTQNIEMGADLALQCPAFKLNLERILAVFREEHDLDLSAYLWHLEKAQDITSTLIAQPLLFAVELALAQTLNEFGVVPDFVFGHSLGEVIAAAFSGVFDLHTAAALIIKRAQCMDKCEPGEMLAIERLDGLEQQLGGVAIAAHNAPTQSVLAGSFERIDEIVAKATAAGVAHQRLRTSHAFHSPLMQEGATQFMAYMKEVKFGQARIPLISNITGRLLTEYEYKNPVYWADHLLKTVQFSKSIQTLRELGVRTFVEVGHGFAMKNLIQSNWEVKSADPARIVPALGAAEEEYQSFLSVIAAYWTLSGTLELAPFVEGKCNAALPVYPFEKTRHWIDPVIGFRPSGEATGTTTACSVVVPLPSAAPVKQALPGPQVTNEANPVEALVLGIYESYLGEEIDPTMSFFDLGGNSLIAIQMINKLRETFNLDIPLRGFYGNSSVTAMSLQIAEQLLEDEVEHV
ncbi:acyltransferase domain-containing protein [Marinobacterium sp. D7]|uniref:type I polyketide synthase n=1 Tax=Marinobacterium ramblicola TaxID=2849041 RepID=UPI001C2CDBC3|nr:type I polyketide synthase [Marinobacterium ramblicola]MBV1787463.1 acyltransferase domain-containing protein [Marinobacterium ramblicola]